MASNELEIVLKLVDEATGKLKEVTGKLKGETDSLGKSGQKAGESFSKSFKRANQDVRSFRQAMIPIGIIIAGIIKTTSDWAKTNQKTKTAYDDLKKATTGLSASIGSLLAPSITGLSMAIVKSTENLDKFFKTAREGYSKLFDSMTYLTQYSVSFYAQLFSGSDMKNAHSIAQKVAEQSAKDLSKPFNEAIGLNDNRSIMDLGAATLFQSDKKKDKKSYDPFALPFFNKEDVIIKIKEFKDEYAKQMEEVKTKTEEVMDIISSSISSNLSDAIVGIKSFSEAWKNIWTSMASYLIDNVIKKIVQELLKLKAIQSGIKFVSKFLGFHDGGQVMHAGGIIRAHNGLAVDEVPIIAQKGEGILSRKGMSALGGVGSLNALNSGKGVGGQNTINIYIQKADMVSTQKIDDVAERLGFSIEKSLRLGRGI